MLTKNNVTQKYYRNGTEITADEYEALLAEAKKKTAYVNKLVKGEITIDDVPAEWQEEIQRRVDERIAVAQEEPDLTADEVLDIILGGAVC